MRCVAHLTERGCPQPQQPRRWSSVQIDWRAIPCAPPLRLRQARSVRCFANSGADPYDVAAGQKLEAKVLLQAVRLYPAKRLDVYGGTVKQV